MRTASYLGNGKSPSPYSFDTRSLLLAEKVPDKINLTYRTYDPLVTSLLFYNSQPCNPSSPSDYSSYLLAKSTMYLLFLFGTVGLFAAAANSYAITGPTGGVNVNTGERPFRQEISNFQNSGAAWDLYILAFQKFTQTDQAQQLSYYQVAGVLRLCKNMITVTNKGLGVHGRPYIPWDGVNGNYQAVSKD